MIDKDRLMHTSSESFAVEPLRAKLSAADDRIRLNHWMPPQRGIAPRIRIGLVKWIAAIEFVHDFADLGAGQGGYNEDHGL